jgi:hypothetical protein
MNRRFMPAALARALAVPALAFWLYYAVLRQVAGALNPDEVYFAHIFWLLDEGKRQYVDFYSNHLPAYFQLLKPLVAALSDGGSDLSFVWGLRAVSAVIILAYLALAWRLHRSTAPDGGRAGVVATATLMLVFVVMARMVEVRPDTIGLLLVNAAWALVLCMPGRAGRVGAAVVAGLALLFSARAAGMAGVLGLCVLALSIRARDRRGVLALLAVAGGFVAAGLLAALAAPEWVERVIRACFLDAARFSNVVPLRLRFLTPERLPLVLLLVAGFAGGLRMARQGLVERGLVVATACAAQVLLVVIDPAPYEYVYGWAAVPAVVGVAGASGVLAAAFPLALAGVLVAASIDYGLRTGQPPPASSFLRLTFDAPLARAEVERLPTAELAALLISDARQKFLGNQLRVRSELCRRLGGTVLASFDTHPVCLPDALYYWTAIRWPALAEGDAPSTGALPQQEFERMFLQARPRVLLWGHRWEAPRPLLPTTRGMLACCYDLHDGFALARQAPPGPPNAP